VDSAPGLGSRFFFTAALDVAAEDGAQGVSLSVAGVRTLIVVADATDRQIIGEVLAHWGAVPTLAATGADARVQVQQALEGGAAFDLFLVDAEMPDGDGVALAAELQSRSKAPCIVIGGTEEDTPERAHAPDVYAFLAKPVRQRELFAAMVGAASAAATSAGPPSAAACRHGAPGGRVLLAEDNPVNQLVARSLLTSMGYEVRVAADGFEAVQLYCAEPFDLVCMDLQMPSMGGLDATAEIRRLEEDRGTHVPIVAVTAHAMRGDRERCLAAGMDGYVAKPIRREELAAEIERASAMAAAAPVPARPGANEGALRLRDDDDPALFAEVAAVYLGNARAWRERLVAALEGGDAEAAARAAHTLKGALAVLCEGGPLPLVQSLEAAARRGDLAWARSLLASALTGLDLLQARLAAVCAAVE
jgi:CheY-like chemotaxis protein